MIEIVNLFLNSLEYDLSFLCGILLLGKFHDFLGNSRQCMVQPWCSFAASSNADSSSAGSSCGSRHSSRKLWHRQEISLKQVVSFLE